MSVCRNLSAGETELNFMFEKGPVGRFEESEYPHREGRYRYMPYRSQSHYAMQKLLRAGGVPRCYYDAAGVRISFAVRDCPKHGVLELVDFSEE